MNERPRKIFFPNLDILRFFAFFLVFFEHAISSRFFYSSTNKVVQGFSLPGTIGVDIFFVLSGFLITYLLTQEGSIKGGINIGHFYLRRVLRIWPLYYLIMICAFFVLPRISPGVFGNNCHNPILAFSILENIDTIQARLKNCNVPNISIAWSVAIEEQFYLFFPILFALTFRNKLVFIGISSLLILFSYMHFSTTVEGGFGFFYNIKFLMIGAVGAYCISYMKDMTSIVSFTNKYSIVNFILFLVLYGLRFLPAMQYISFVLLPFVYLFFVVQFCFGSVGFLSSIPKIKELGMYTYGFYLYHQTLFMIIQIVFDKCHLNYLTNTATYLVLVIVSFFATIGVSYLSYRYFEKFFIDLKKKFTVIPTR